MCVYLSYFIAITAKLGNNMDKEKKERENFWY